MNNSRGHLAALRHEIDPCGLARLDAAEIGLAEIREHEPQRGIDEGKDLLPSRGVGARCDLKVCHIPITRRVDFAVGNLEFEITQGGGGMLHAGVASIELPEFVPCTLDGSLGFAHKRASTLGIRLRPLNAVG